MVVAAAGYPEAPSTGDPITGIEAARGDRQRSCSAPVSRATAERPASPPAVACCVVVGDGPTTADAIAAAYAGVGHITLPGMQVRRDIGRTPVAVRGAAA